MTLEARIYFYVGVFLVLVCIAKSIGDHYLMENIEKPLHVFYTGQTEIKKIAIDAKYIERRLDRHMEDSRTFQEINGAVISELMLEGKLSRETCDFVMGKADKLLKKRLAELMEMKEELAKMQEEESLIWGEKGSKEGLLP